MRLCCAYCCCPLRRWRRMRLVYGKIEVGGKELTNSAETPVVYATTDKDGVVTTEGATAENYNVMWDGSTLTLRNATIKEAEEYSDKNDEKIAIYRQSGDLAIALVGENTVDAPGGGRGLPAAE